MRSIASIYRRNLCISISLWSFVFGVFVASFIRIHPLVCILIWLVALVIYYVDKNILILLALCAFALGAFRFDIKDFHDLQPAAGHGSVVNEPEHRDSDTRFVVKTDAGEKILVSTDLLNPIQYGDEVDLIGKAERPTGDYAKYLSKDDIHYTMSFTKVIKVSSGNGNYIKQVLLSIKSSFVERMKKILPEPESSLLAGLVVSGRHAMPEEVLSDFRRAGVVHIVVLSGFNITIISEFMLLLFGFLGTRRAAIASAIGITLFTLLAGATATVVRAAIMVLVLLLGKIMGRRGSSGRVLLFTAVLMLVWNPKMLVFDPSFQLSFLAMLALIYVVPIAKRYLVLIPERFSLRTIIATTLATQAVVFPYLIYNMGNFSTVFLLSNLLILPLVPITMLIGFVATILAYISSLLAWPIAFASHILLAWILAVAHFLGNLSFALIQIDSFPFWLTLIIYAGLGFSLWRFRSSFQPIASLD